MEDAYMKIAVTATGTNLDAPLDPRFGRAQYILIVDENETLLEAVDNSRNINAMRGAGIQAGKILADKKVDILLTGHCGPNAFTTLKAAGIKVGVDQSGTVREALARYKRNEVRFVDQPDVDGHW
jgi:predicted Fe-Mo cluster-binding NifX family protein